MNEIGWVKEVPLSLKSNDFFYKISVNPQENDFIIINKLTTKYIINASACDWNFSSVKTFLYEVVSFCHQ